ncbi:MAG: hypothetical protein B7Z40_14390 [Bosea sp. 12-68-7]|nr:MAG: hypothetical protein B7Z40_14390 [Bosea sp. 12-68-7]
MRDPAGLLRRLRAAGSAGPVRAAWPALRARLAGFDPARALIRFADGVEAAFTALLRPIAILRRVLRLPAVRLTTGLAWRGLAAAAGIGLAATLVTALSSQSEATITPPAEPQPIRDVAQAARTTPAGRDSWIEISKPIAMFSLESPDLDRATMALEARRSPDGSRREELLTFGALTDSKAHLALRLTVEAAQDDLSQPFIIALVRAAAARALSVQRSGLPAAIQTRFGPVEAADATLSDGHVSRACVAFRREAGALPLAMSGWWCGAEGRPADRRQLVCLIDRLDLLNAGEDRALRTAFARTELNRQPGCVTPRLSATGRKVSWLDADGPTPALRTKTATVAVAGPRKSEKR